MEKEAIEEGLSDFEDEEGTISLVGAAHLGKWGRQDSSSVPTG